MLVSRPSSLVGTPRISASSLAIIVMQHKGHLNLYQLNFSVLKAMALRKDHRKHLRIVMGIGIGMERSSFSRFQCRSESVHTGIQLVRGHSSDAIASMTGQGRRSIDAPIR